MKRTIWAAAVVLTCVTTAGLLAQPPESQPPASSQDKTVTITGCLAADDTKTATATTGTGGTAASASAAESFVLKNAKMGPGTAAGTTGTGTTGTGTTPPGTSASASTGPVYKLSGSSSELKPHVGHQVEVSGTLTPSSSSTSGGAAAGAGTGARTGASASASPAGEVRVRSVKMIAATCPM